MDSRSRSLLVMAAGCGVLFVIVLVGAYLWEPGQSLDRLGMTGFVTADSGLIESLTGRLVQLGDPPEVALMTCVLGGLALARGRPRVALALVVLVAATSVSSQLLKALLSHPREAPHVGWIVGPEAFPSGHSTAAMSLALGAVIAAPRRARPAAAVLGALLALAVGGSVVARGWHFPSDVLGGYLLATAWALVLVALLREADRRFPASRRWAAGAVARMSDQVAERGMAAIAVGGVLSAAIAGLVVLAGDPDGAAAFAREHTSALVVAGAVASAALALPVAMAALVRRS